MRLLACLTTGPRLFREAMEFVLMAKLTDEMLLAVERLLV